MNKENNKLIAEFMGDSFPLRIAPIFIFEYDSEGHWSDKKIIGFDEAVTEAQKDINENTGSQEWDFTDLSYDKSWHSLMPVVEECLSKVGDSVDAEKYYTEIHDSLWSINIDETYKSVVNFIKWYNENK